MFFVALSENFQRGNFITFNHLHKFCSIISYFFFICQGPPGQMAYVHFEDVSEVIVSTELATRPDQLVSFLVSSILQQQTTQQAHRVRTHSMDAAATAAAALDTVGTEGSSGNEGRTGREDELCDLLELEESGESARLLGPASTPSISLPALPRSSRNSSRSRSNSRTSARPRARSYSSVDAPRSPLSLISSNESPEPPSVKTATRAALDVAKQAVQLLEAQLDAFDLVVQDNSRHNISNILDSPSDSNRERGTAPIVFRKPAEPVDVV